MFKLNILNRYPFLRMVIPLIIGIRISSQLSIPNHGLAILITICSLTAIILAFILKYRYSWVWGILVSFIILLTGVHSTRTHLQQHDFQLPSEPVFYKGYVLEYPDTSFNQLKIAVKLHDQWNIACNVILYYPINESIELHPGSRIQLRCMLRKFKNKENPGEFDYAGYMQSRGYFHYAYVQRQDILIEKGEFKSLKIIAERFRRSLILKLKQELPNPEYVSVASSITLGYKNELDESIKSNFANSGAMHVLAVSGLHVGIIFLITSTLTFFIGKKFPWLQNLIILLVLWAFAFTTGLSSSAVRASTMFSIFLIGKTFSFKSNGLNILAFTALLMLLYNPLNIYNTGFQLSFMAMASLIIFYPIIYPLVTAPNKFLNYLWKLTAVSLSVQLGVLPLSVYYFHQIPIYFLFSNLLVMAITGIIIMLCILLFCLSPGIISMTVSKGISGFMFILIQGLEKIAQFPGSVITPLHLNIYQLAGLYCIIISTILFLVNKKVFHLKTALMFSIVYTLIGTYFGAFHHKKTILVYNNRTQDLIEFSDHGHNLLMCEEPEGLNTRTIENYHQNIFLNQYEEIHSDCTFYVKKHFIQRQFSYIQFYNTKIIYIRSYNDVKKLKNKKSEPIQILIVSNNVKFDPHKLNLTFDKLVLTSTNTNYSLNYWKNLHTFDKNKLHVIAENGAFYEEIMTPW